MTPKKVKPKPNQSPDRNDQPGKITYDRCDHCGAMILKKDGKATCPYCWK